MKKTLLSLFFALTTVVAAMAEEKTIIIDGYSLPVNFTLNHSVSQYGGVDIKFSKGTKRWYIGQDGKNNFTDSVVFIGKNGAYICNKTAIPGPIKKFEIYANKGASAKVSVGVYFSPDSIAKYNENSVNTYAATLSTLDNVYDCSDKLPVDARYFWYQVTNANNSQVQFRITYEEDNANHANKPTLPASTTFSAENKEVTITNNHEGATVYYTTDGTEPTTSSTSFTGASKTITVSATTTVKAIAVIEGMDNSRVAYATYTKTVYSSFEDLIAADLVSGTTVKVTFSQVKIKTKTTNGTYLELQKGGKDVMIYFKNVPETWTQGGLISGTMECPWKNYNGTWELVPDSKWTWTSLTYEEASKLAPALKVTLGQIEVGGVVSYAVEYDGDGALSVTSNNESVATAVLKDGKLTISALKVGTCSITISAPETDKCQAVQITRTTTVVEKFAPAAIPFSFDGGRSEATRDKGILWSGIDTDYAQSPKLKFNDTDDSFIVAMNASAAYVHYSIKGYPAKDVTWSGTFEVQESEDGEEYTLLKQYKALGDSVYETYSLKEDTRFVRFLFVAKDKGNVALGTINIDNVAPANIDAVTTKGPKPAARKSIVNGRIVIIQNGKMYSLTGQEIKE